MAEYLIHRDFPTTLVLRAHIITSQSFRRRRESRSVSEWLVKKKTQAFENLTTQKKDLLKKKARKGRKSTNPRVK